MLKKFKKVIQDVKVAIAIGMSNSDKQIMSGVFSKAPEGSAMTNPNYSQNGFLRSVQLGQMKEQQLERYYEVLNAMDHIHTRTRVEWIEVDIEPGGQQDYIPVYDVNGKVIEGRGLVAFAVPMTPEEIEAQDRAVQVIGDVIEGYNTKLFIANKDVLFVDKTNIGFDPSVLTENEKTIWIKTGVVYRPTVILNRPLYGLRGAIKMEDFTSEVLVKERADFNSETDRDVILEFYCMNYNWRQKQYETDNGIFRYDENGNVLDDDYKPDLVYNEVTKGLNLNPFIELETVTLVQNTATRNDIRHNYEITSFIEIKKFGKQFVVKFNANKI